jgi:tagatose 1,6-diphosphate aldolase GatY/KbaY
VLHGTSGVPDEVVKDCISKGICKVNYATDLRIAFSNGIKEYLSKDSQVFDPKKYNAYARSMVKECVMQKIHVCGSVNKA